MTIPKNKRVTHRVKPAEHTDKNAAPPAHAVAPTEVAEGIAARAAEGILGPNPFVGLRPHDLLASAGDVVDQAIKHPILLLEQEAALARDLIGVLAGSGDLAPAPTDKRFLDAAWKANPFFSALLQSHLAWSRALGGFVERSGLKGGSKERARFVMSLLTDALAPTNTLLGNPAALKKFVDTGGTSIVKGLQNMLHDLQVNKGMPAQVDTSAFEVGKNLALTPGAVVFRNPVLELIQYAPITDTVYARPQLFVPPQVNKYYVFDLSPGKSVVEFLVGSGFQVFMISWRNPTKAQRDWGMDTYVESLLEAISAVQEITGSEDINLHGACSGAMTMAALLGHLAAKRKRLVNAATLMVAVLDNRAESQLGSFVTPETIAFAKKKSASNGVLEGEEMGHVFAWMRPNDLVWNYWVNNYLQGNPPPAFDILYWNHDSTRLTAKFHGELLDIFAGNLLVKPSGLTVLGTAVDLAKVDCDKYLLAGTTDHITPWKGVFNTSQAFGGTNQFIVSSSGHIQSIINPPGNPKSKFLMNEGLASNADEWLAGATTIPGSWWTHWSKWLAARSGERRASATALGSEQHPPLGPSPGTYVREH
jgi:polyhydroxyalkanoate synthase subunit PhaC